jgi:hypothetical protein
LSSCNFAQRNIWDPGAVALPLAPGSGALRHAEGMLPA